VGPEGSLLQPVKAKARRIAQNEAIFIQTSLR